MAEIVDLGWAEALEERDMEALARALAKAKALGADAKSIRLGGQTLLMLAANEDWGRGCAALAPICDPDARDADGDTPLMAAIKWGHGSAVAALARWGDADLADLDGAPLTHLAIREGYARAAATLAARADLLARDEQGRTALELALADEDEGLCLDLLSAGGSALLAARDSDGDEPLASAVKWRLGGVALAMARMASPERANALDSRGDPPLCLALSHGLPEVAMALAAKADAGARDADGDDAFACAAFHGHWAVAEALAARLDPLLPCSNGLLALDAAWEWGRPDLALAMASRPGVDWSRPEALGEAVLARAAARADAPTACLIAAALGPARARGCAAGGAGEPWAPALAEMALSMDSGSPPDAAALALSWSKAGVEPSSSRASVGWLARLFGA